MGTSTRAMTLAIIFFAILLRPAVGQTNFGGGSQNSNPSSDVNTRLFTGNQALDSGLVGIGLGALGATFLAPAVGNALSGGGNSGFNNNGFNNNGNSYNACGKRRKRQVDGQTRFFLPNGGSCTCGKRKKRQAQSRIFFGGNNNNCGSCCYNNGYANGFNNGNSNNFNTGNFNNGDYNQGNYNQGSFNTGSFNVEDVNATTVLHSRTKIGTRRGLVGGQTTPGELGATHLGGAITAV